MRILDLRHDEKPLIDPLCEKYPYDDVVDLYYALHTNMKKDGIVRWAIEDDCESFIWNY